MSPSEQADALESLGVHPGWGLWIDHLKSEWGPNGATYNAELDKALNLLDDNAAASQARQVRAGRRTIEALVGWRVEEIARLRRAQPGSEPTHSRRGGL